MINALVIAPHTDSNTLRIKLAAWFPDILWNVTRKAADCKDLTVFWDCEANPLPERSGKSYISLHCENDSTRQILLHCTISLTVPCLRGAFTIRYQSSDTSSDISLYALRAWLAALAASALNQIADSAPKADPRTPLADLLASAGTGNCAVSLNGSTYLITRVPDYPAELPQSTEVFCPALNSWQNLNLRTCRSLDILIRMAASVPQQFSEADFAGSFAAVTGFPVNRFHPLVWIIGNPEIGSDVYIGGMSEVNARDARVVIGNSCDIASFVVINCADSHKRCIGLCDSISRLDIIIGDHVFIGSHSVIKGGARIGHHSVVAAGTIVDGGTEIPPYSLVSGNPMQIKPRYYEGKIRNPRSQHSSTSISQDEYAAAPDISNRHDRDDLP